MYKFLILFFVSTLIPNLHAGETEAGYEIAKEMMKRDSGYGSYSAVLEMKITAGNGDTFTRSLLVKGIEQQGDGDRIITYFETPKDVSGTTLLTYSHAIDPDDQWLYLPSINRVKRISSNNRAGPFMGSELAYEDMSSWELEKYQYKLLRETTLNQHSVWVLECIPQYEKSGYSRLVVWLDKEMYQPRKIQYYDRKGSELKVMVLTDYAQYEQKYWRPHKAEVENIQNQRKTELQWKQYKIGVTVSNRSFEPGQLKFAYRNMKK